MFYKLYLLFNAKILLYSYIVLGSMYETMSITTGLYPNLDLWNANKLQLQLHDSRNPSTTEASQCSTAITFATHFVIPWMHVRRHLLVKVNAGNHKA